MRVIDYTKLSDSSNQVLQRANTLARDSHYDEIGTSLVLIGIVQQSKEMMRFILNELSVDYASFCSGLSDYLQRLPRFNASSPDYSDSVLDAVEIAISTNQRLQGGLVSPEHILIEIASLRHEASQLFEDFNITKNRLKQAVAVYTAGNRINERDDNEGFVLHNLERYAVNLRQLANDKIIEPSIGREEEVRRILQIISRKTKNNPLLIGEPGTGKTAIIEGLAVRLNRGDVPNGLKDIQIYSLDVANLIAGASMQGEFESRLKSIISELKVAPNVVLFIDEIHLLLGTGSNGGAMDAANILKPELARSGIRLIGATTFDEYNKFIESDTAFARRFQRVIVEEPNIEDSITILRGIKSRFETHHRIKILDEAIVSAVKLSAKYITDRFLPDKAIDILDETASRMRIERTSVPSELDDLSRLVRQKEIEKQSLMQDGDGEERIDELVREISQLKERENVLNATWINERRQFERLQDMQDSLEELKANREHAESSGRYEEAARLNRQIENKSNDIDRLIDEMSATETSLLKLALDADEIKDTITLATGIPISSMTSDELTKVNAMPDILAESVKGQDHAIETVCNVIKRSRLGLGNENSPIGSFLFMGTTGVGKTELAKTLAETLFGSRDMLIRIDMSEYQLEHSVARLFGAPPGYVGYDQGGQLTEAVRRKPYSVVLLDEIEKAHSKVCETLLQVLDDGRMTDGKGRIINFKNTIIIMTSNLGADTIETAPDCQSDSIKATLTHLLKQRISPEFVNRIDDIVIFNPLSESVLRKIAIKIVKDCITKLELAGYEITTDENVYDFIASEVDTRMGARPIKRIVNHQIIDGLVDCVLSGALSKDRVINIGISNRELSFSNI